MCSDGMTVGVSRHRGDDVVGERGGVRRGEPDPLEARHRPDRAQQVGERAAVAELDPVGVDVLPEQRDLDRAGGHQRLDLGEDLAGPAVALLAAQRRHDAERAGVVAAHADRDPARRTPTPAGWAGSRGTPGATRRSPPGRPRCAAPGPAAGAARRCCACRTPRPPTAPARRSRRGPSAPGTRRRRSACPGRAALSAASWPRLPYSRVEAFSRTAQVLSTTTSADQAASSAGSARDQPGLLEQARPCARSRGRSSGSPGCAPGRCGGRRGPPRRTLARRGRAHRAPG